MKMISIEAQVTEPKTVSIVWIRGDTKEESGKIEIHPSQGGLAQINQNFTKRVWIYGDEQKGYHKKDVFISSLLICISVNLS